MVDMGICLLLLSLFSIGCIIIEFCLFNYYLFILVFWLMGWSLIWFFLLLIFLMILIVRHLMICCFRMDLFYFFIKLLHFLMVIMANFLLLLVNRQGAMLMIFWMVFWIQLKFYFDFNLIYLILLDCDFYYLYD